MFLAFGYAWTRLRLLAVRYNRSVWRNMGAVQSRGLSAKSRMDEAYNESACMDRTILVSDALYAWIGMESIIAAGRNAMRWDALIGYAICSNDIIDNNGSLFTRIEENL